MYCIYCGTNINDKANFCQKCGSKVEHKDKFEDIFIDISDDFNILEDIDTLNSDDKFNIEKINEENFENIINKKLEEEKLLINEDNEEEINSIEFNDNISKEDIKKSEFVKFSTIAGLVACLYLSVTMFIQNEELGNKIDDIHEISSLRLNAYNNSQNELEQLYQQIEILEVENEALNLKLNDAKVWFEMTANEKQAIINSKQAQGGTTPYNAGISYEQIARNPEQFIGHKVQFEGKVIQVLEIGEEVRVRVSLDENETQVLYGVFNKSLVPYRILEGDIISVIGQSSGLFSYNSTEGKSVSIPAIEIQHIGQVQPAESVESVQPVQPQK